MLDAREKAQRKKATAKNQTGGGASSTAGQQQRLPGGSIHRGRQLYGANGNKRSGQSR